MACLLHTTATPGIYEALCEAAALCGARERQPGPAKSRASAQFQDCRDPPETATQKPRRAAAQVVPWPLPRLGAIPWQSLAEDLRSTPQALPSDPLVAYAQRPKPR